MTGPRDVPVRTPAVAGMFYPADADRCREVARRLVESAPRPLAPPPAGDAGRWLGGIVPHAGWICSGAIAAQTIATIARSAVGESGPDAGGAAAEPLLVVIFGAVHSPVPLQQAVLDEYARWQLPGDACEVADEVRRRLREGGGAAAPGELFRADNRFHQREHAIEVELPLVRQASSGAAVLPVEVPLVDEAVAIGRAAARRVIESNRRAIFLASSDLTHYGPEYSFAPAGVGIEGLAWAKDNDRRLLEQVEALRPEQVVREVREHANACGGGAIAAMLSACRELGATRATVLRHANSYETLADVAPQRPDNAVGYAAVVVG